MTAKTTDASDAAASVQRLAVLLEAGVTPPRAWQLLAESGEEVATTVCAAGPARAVGEVLAEQPGAWREVAVAWRVAETVGAPLAPSLRRFADALRDAQETRDDVAVALADPAATARLVAWLPLVAIGLAVALGFDVVTTLTQPSGARGRTRQHLCRSQRLTTRAWQPARVGGSD